MNIKKKLLVFLTALICMAGFTAFADEPLILEYDGAQHEYTGSVYKLMVNDEYVETSLHPIIFNDYALVPIREVFESMGATVKFVDLSQQIFIQHNDKYVRLKIGSSEAYIDADKAEIPGSVTPMLIAPAGKDAKTMVPVRFVSESLGMLVEFDGENGIIKINDPSFGNKAVINNYKCTMFDELTATMEIYSDTPISEISTPVLTDANVLYFDVPNAQYTIENSNEINIGAIKYLRLGQHDGFTRIALDLDNVSKYKTALSSDGKIILISITAQPPEGEEKDEDISADGKIVVIDAGHGGSDPGAIGSIDGLYYNEKDLNLAMAHAVRDILVENNVAVKMTREGDTYPTLTERAEYANANNAVIFISIHANSATTSSASGYEVYYSEMNNSQSTGLSSSRLAQSILKSISKNVTARNRGVKTADHVVTRSSMMPAALIEVGFVSNPDELATMLTDEFRNNFAKGIADGILAVINDANQPW